MLDVIYVAVQVISWAACYAARGSSIPIAICGGIGSVIDAGILAIPMKRLSGFTRSRSSPPST